MRWRLLICSVGVYFFLFNGSSFAQEKRFLIDRYPPGTQMHNKGGSFPAMRRSNGWHDKDHITIRKKWHLEVDWSQQRTHGFTDVIPVRVIAPPALRKKYKGQTFYIGKRWVKGMSVIPPGPERVKKQAERTLTPPAPRCPPDNSRADVERAKKEHRRVTSTSSRLARGMNKVIAGMFRDCDAPNIVVGNLAADGTGNEVRYPSSSGISITRSRDLKRWFTNLFSADEEEYRSSHPILRYLERKSKKGGLTSVEVACLHKTLDQPPVYGLGASAQRKGKKGTSGTTVLTQDQRPIGKSGVGSHGIAVSAIDCSKAIGAAMEAAGLKFTPDQGLVKETVGDRFLVGGKRIDPLDVSTRTFAEIGRRRRIELRNNRKTKFCFDVPKIGKSGSIQAGDVINVYNRHVIMIDSVQGNDPFGLNRARSIKDCRAVSHNASGFNFVISHSSNTRHLGLHKVEASTYFSDRQGGVGDFANTFFDFVEQVCRARFNGKDEIPGADWESRTSHHFFVLRHRSSDPKCVKKPEKIAEEECIKDCDKVI